MVRLQQTHGWYDLTATVDTDAGFKWQLAGHVESGRASISDPAMGRATANGSPV
jgi:phospholipase C